MPRDVGAYLSEQQRKTSGEVASEWGQIEELYNKKLWHQLTLKLLNFVKNPIFSKGDGLIKMYENFIADFEHRINLLALAELTVYIVKQMTDADAAVSFIEKIKVKASEEAKILCLHVTTMGTIELRTRDLPAKELIVNFTTIDEECSGLLDCLDGVMPVHGRFYELSSNYHKLMGNHDGEALRYLGCTDLEDIPEPSQHGDNESYLVERMMEKEYYYRKPPSETFCDFEETFQNICNKRDTMWNNVPRNKEDSEVKKTTKTKLTEHGRSYFNVCCAQSCPESALTSKDVGSCPTTESKWKARASIKKCEQIKQNCTTRENYQYHCVPNSNHTGFIEICATVINVIGGHCITFDKTANILRKTERICADHPKSCPPYYKSKDLYKFQECYSILDEASTSDSTSTTPSISSSPAVTVNPDSEEKLDKNLSMVLYIVGGGVVLLIISMSIYCWRIKDRKKKKFRPNGQKKEKKEAAELLEIIVLTNDSDSR